LVAYSVPGGRCYFREVLPDDSVIGWFGERGTYCPWLFGLDAGFLGISGVDPDGRSQDLSVPGAPVAVKSEGFGRKPRAGDIYLGLCGDLSDEEDASVSEAGSGCAYAPKSRTLYRLGDSLDIDPRGRVWEATASDSVRVSDGSRRWESEPFRDHPARALTGADGSAIIWFDMLSGPQVTSDAGRTWQRLTGVPSDDQEPLSPAMLHDGRLMLGATNGQFWRGTDPENNTFQAIEAGPIDTAVVAGDRLYGLTDLGDDRRLRDLAWVSEDDGSTWTQVFDARGASPQTAALPADQLNPVDPAKVAARIARLEESGVAVADDGLVLISYQGTDKQGTTQTAWRLYDRRDRVVAEGPDAWFADPAGSGFVLATGQGLRFLDNRAQLSRISAPEGLRRPVTSGDVLLPEHGVYRPSTREVFTGAAVPDGTVSATDGQGRMWAVGRSPRGRTVVRWAVPGQAWTSRDIGPAIGARTVVGKGSTLIVAGRRDLYLSTDSGATWERVTHGASAYSGRPVFVIRPDKTILGGDSRAGYRISYDGGHTFQDAAPREAEARLLGAMFARGEPGATEVSVDRKHWQRFTPGVARQIQDSNP
jgi:hypothetical protein